MLLVIKHDNPQVNLTEFASLKGRKMLHLSAVFTVFLGRTSMHKHKKVCVCVPTPLVPSY